MFNQETKRVDGFDVLMTEGILTNDISIVIFKQGNVVHELISTSFYLAKEEATTWIKSYLK